MIKIGQTIIEQNHFPDNSLLLKVETNEIRLVEGTIIIQWYYESDAELFTLICLRKHFSDAHIALFMPYCPHARMDRVKNDNDVFTLKYFAEVINSLNFDLVFCEDVHSNVAAALINNFYPLDSEYAGIRNLYSELDLDTEGELIVCYPDEGAMKRYSDKIDAPYAFGIKKRDWKTGKILGLELMNKELVKGRDVLIIDDICSRGGTFYYTAKALKEAGVNNIYLYVTHCEKTVLNGDLIKSGLVKEIFTTDSILSFEDVENPSIPTPITITTNYRGS